MSSNEHPQYYEFAGVPVFLRGLTVARLISHIGFVTV